MEIFLIFSLVIIAISLIAKKVFYSAKSNLFKNQEAWSGKDIKIKYTNSKNNSGSKENDNFLKMIANESKIYLEDQETNEHNDT